MSKEINVTRSSMPDFEEYCEEIKDMWDSCWLTNSGIKHRTFQAELRKFLGCENVELYTNGHLALENIISAMGLKGEIITTPFTFASTTNAIVRCGCTPVFCDINPVDYTIDADKIEALITDRTSAILPVHVYGNLCDVEKIQDIADRHSLKVIYDAAHAFAVSKNGISSGCFGDASMFSFHATKVFHTIEGGCLCFKDSSLADKLFLLKNFGIAGPEDVLCVGGNAKMSEFCAAMGICNLRHLPAEIERRHTAYSRYVERLSGVEGIILSAPQENVRPNYAYFPVVFDGYKYSRNQIFEMLDRENIHTRKYFYPLTNAFECYRGRPGFDPALTPVAADIAEKVLTLPMYADLTAEDVDRICDIILK